MVISIYNNFAGDDAVPFPFSFSQLETKQTDTDLSKILDELRFVKAPNQAFFILLKIIMALTL